MDQLNSPTRVTAQDAHREPDIALGDLGTSQQASAEQSNTVVIDAYTGEQPAVGLKVPVLVSAYHLVIVVLTICAIISPFGDIQPNRDWREILLLVAAMGATGGALNASRRVVLAVRYRKYYMSRLLWQLLTPVHSALLAAVAFLAIEGGLLSLARTAERAEPKYTLFVMAAAFFVGFVSEVFVKRLIAAADALFGEAGNAKASDPERDGKLRAEEKTHSI